MELLTELAWNCLVDRVFYFIGEHLPHGFALGEVKNILGGESMEVKPCLE
jgi:hypothetical protein